MSQIASRSLWSVLCMLTLVLLTGCLGSDDEPEPGEPLEPGFASPDAVTVVEGTIDALAVATVNFASIPALTINGGDDAALFALDPATGLLTFLTAPDFSAPADANADNIYELQLRADDGADVVDQDLTVTVTDLPTVGPDLTVQSITLPIMPLAPSVPWQMDCLIANTGAEDAGPFKVEITVVGFGGVVSTGSYSLSGLSAINASLITVNMSGIPGNGTFVGSVFADADEQVLETDESNNKSPFTVTTGFIMPISNN